MKKPNSSPIIVVRADESQKKKLQLLADKYMGGNLSKWLRDAGLKYRPKLKR